MKKRLPPWCKLVKHTLIDKDMDVSELATKPGWQDHIYPQLLTAGFTATGSKQSE